MAKKLIVLSLDALQTGDLDLLFQLPYCSQLAEKCAIVKNVREIYPTLTYPIHTAIVTGVRPEKNGIPHNQKPGITRDEPNWSIMGSDWYWEKEGIQVPTLVDAVWEDGRTAGDGQLAGDRRGYPGVQCAGNLAGESPQRGPAGSLPQGRLPCCI